jgi:hypothetical protein
MFTLRGVLKMIGIRECVCVYVYLYIFTLVDILTYMKCRGVLIIIGIGFHFISQSPFDVGSTMAAFLPQV